MGAPASQGFASRTPTLQFVGDPLDAGLRSELAKAFTRSRFCRDPPGPEIGSSDLAVGVFTDADDRSLLAFARWAHATGALALFVELGEHEILIGPLARPGKAGCGWCAFERRAAVSAAGSSSQRVSRPADASSRLGRVLVREVRAIVRRGPEQALLVDHVLAVDLNTLDESLHRVIPLSRCPVCGGAAAFAQDLRKSPGLSAEDSPPGVLDALAGWVDCRTGVISAVVLEPPGDMPAGLPFIATAAPPHVFEGGSLRRLPLGWGKGLTISGAVLSAVGEAIERYAASLPDEGRIVWERPSRLNGEILDPRTCSLYTDAQYDGKDFPYRRYDPDARHPWIQGKWLGSGSQVWVPAVFAFLSLTLEPEHLICQGTSNGLAASTDPDDAARRATLELVERDAFMAAWLLACPGLRIDLDVTLDPQLRSVLDGIEALGATVEVYSLPTSACGATVLCLAIGDGDGYPGVTIGLGADLEIRAALRQAVLELGQTGPHLRRMMRANALPIPEDAKSVREMLDHAAYYFPRRRAKAFDQLRSSVATLELRHLAAKVIGRSVPPWASVLEAAGIRVALVDLTPPDVATGPFSVVRAVSPDLQPLSYGYGFEREPVKRIRGLSATVPAIHPIW